LDDKSQIIERISGEGKVLEYDKLDEQIITTFSLDVRQSLSKVAYECNTSVETVRRRIIDLEKKKVIVGYKIDLDLGKLGYQGYRVDFSLIVIRGALMTSFKVVASA